MVDILKHIERWRDGSDEDWAVAVKLVKDGNTRHGLFFAHLAIEKMLKAHVCRHTENIAPKIHNLLRLAELAAITLSQEQTDVLADMNAFQIESRYPEMLRPPPSKKESEEILSRAKEVYTWLTDRL